MSLSHPQFCTRALVSTFPVLSHLLWILQIFIFWPSFPDLLFCSWHQPQHLSPDNPRTLLPWQQVGWRWTHSSPLILRSNPSRFTATSVAGSLVWSLFPLWPHLQWSTMTPRPPIPSLSPSHYPNLQTGSHSLGPFHINRREKPSPLPPPLQTRSFRVVPIIVTESPPTANISCEFIHNPLLSLPLPKFSHCIPAPGSSRHPLLTHRPCLSKN